MVFEILFSVALLLFAAYCLFYVTVSVTVSTVSDPLGSALWPQIILVLLMIVLVINIYQLVKKTPKEERSLDAIKRIDWKQSVTSPFFLGMVCLVIYSLILNTTGFLLTSWILCMVFCYLLGERRPLVIVSFSLATVVVLFLLFYKGMGVQMPRGTVPFLRNFALAVEKLLRMIG